MNDHCAVLTQTDIDDPLWLEAVEGTSALEWVETQNKRTVGVFCQGDGFQRVEGAILRELSLDSRIPWIASYGDYVYNFWQDQAHPAGVWRRTSLKAYRETFPAWETVLDFDQLRREEGVDWVFGGATPLVPDYRYCLIRLSPGGSDACAVREFDLLERIFVEDGFVLPVSKSRVSWIDRDNVYVADALDTGLISASGYPRVLKRWHRGTSLDSARILFEGAFEEIGVYAYRDQTPGFQRDFIVRNIDAYRSETFLLSSDDQLIKIKLPEEAEFSVFKEWLLIMPSSEWRIGTETYSSGNLLATRLNDFLAGTFEITVLFVSTARTALHGFQRVGSHVVLNILENVVSRLEVLSFVDGHWSRSILDSPEPFSTLSINALDLVSDQYLLTVNGFLRPPSLYLGDLASGGHADLLKQVSSDWDLGRYRVNQHFATSVDGTQVPYFEISAADIQLDGQNPTLLYGYGGFQISLQPGYLGIDIPAWLERGGVYVLANIRGGGEFGPAWHQAALRQNRHRSYEDFAAVAQSVIDREVTTASRLGIRGASNGGLLVGNMLTQYPHLFGCIVCEVPLLDMQRYTLLLAGSSWIAEYGDPSCAGQWSYIRSFSPYHNVRNDTSYPPTLFLTSASDDRVSPAHARKMAYRMLSAGHSGIYFHESSGGGHGGSGEHKKSAYRAALVSEFLWSNLARDLQPEGNEMLKTDSA